MILLPRIELKTAAVVETAELHPTRFELKAADKRTFEGLLSTWDLDHGGDMVVPGAFKRWLGEWKATKKTIPLVDLHGRGGEYDSVRQVVGRLVDAEETTEGLMTKWYVLDSPEGNEYQARIKQELVDSLSMGYKTHGWSPPSKEQKELGVNRLLTDVEIREGSLVIWGMNPHALIDTASVKSIAKTLAEIKRESLSDEDRKLLRQSASQIGVLLKPDAPPPADEAAAASTAKSEKPEASPGDTATPKAYEYAEALQQRLFRLRVERTISQIQLGGHST